MSELLQDLLPWFLGILGLLCIPAILIMSLIIGDTLIDWDVKIVNRIAEKLNKKSEIDNQGKK
jgi:hypothetical protein